MLYEGLLHIEDYNHDLYKLVFFVFCFSFIHKLIIYFRAIAAQADKHLVLEINSLYNTTLKYQCLVSSLVYSSTSVSTNRVSADGMTILYKDHSLYILT
jgi:hypothetical protein